MWKSFVLLNSAISLVGQSGGGGGKSWMSERRGSSSVGMLRGEKEKQKRNPKASIAKVGGDYYIV